MNTLAMYLNEFAERCHTNSAAHGFWEDAEEPSSTTLALALQAIAISRMGRTIEDIRQGTLSSRAIVDEEYLREHDALRMGLLSRLTLIVSEVAEAIDAALQGDMDNLHEELADIMIRVGDLAASPLMTVDQFRCSLGEAVVAKMVANEARPYKHGKLA
jgi:NTP pyrophosphatase (non-canonical NTP hydrolase)